MQKNLYFSVLCIFTGIFLSSCGLEEVLTVEEPTITYNDPSYEFGDSTKWYFSFKTSADGGENFIGTDVYYKIYNNSSTLISERASIKSVNTTSNSSAAATRMIETYSYQPLGTSKSTDSSVFFPEVNRSVVFRLLTYANADPASADSDERYIGHACVGIKNGTTYSYSNYIPYRNGNQKSFDFFDNDESDKKDRKTDVPPAYGDPDYKCAEADKDQSFDEYYVQVFAVGVALNPQTVTSSYSLVLDLGSVPIKKGE